MKQILFCTSDTAIVTDIGEQSETETWLFLSEFALE